jgi:hypothetical protein
MKISIAMCTYNGAHFLAEQLESIARQTRCPDELIICDDRSNDATLRIIEEFAKTAPFAVKVSVNEKNLGSTRNFEKAIRLCGGELIALADHDDVWHPEKLAMAEASFTDQPGVGLVFTDAEMVDSSLRPLRHSFWQSINLDGRKQRLINAGRALEVLLLQTVAGGATMVFRASYKPLVLPIPDDGPLIHDGWIALLISAVADIRIITEPSIKYRQHPGQQMGARRVSNLQQVARTRKTDSGFYRKEALQLEQACTRLAEFSSNSSGQRSLDLIRDKIIHLDARASMPQQRVRRLPPILKETMNFHYHRYSRGWFSAFKDLLV